MGRRTSSPCLLGFFTTIFFISFQGSFSEKPKVLGPPHPLCATLGEDTVLRCRLPPGVYRDALEVRWFSSRFEAPIHRYRNGSEEQETQLEEYQGRSELLKEDLQDGTMSLRIRNVTALDGGKYQCRFMTEVSDGAAALELEVADYSACVLQRAVDRLQMKKKELLEEKHTLQLQKAWYYRTIQSAKNRKKICIGPDAKKECFLEPLSSPHDGAIGDVLRWKERLAACLPGGAPPPRPAYVNQTGALESDVEGVYVLTSALRVIVCHVFLQVLEHRIHSASGQNISPMEGAQRSIPQEVSSQLIHQSWLLYCELF